MKNFHKPTKPTGSNSVITNHNGLLFDSGTREVLADDGYTVLDKGTWREFPGVLTEAGVKLFIKLFTSVQKGFEIRTKVESVGGRNVMRGYVYGKGEADSGVEPLVRGWAIGEFLEGWLRQGKSDAYAKAAIKATLDSGSR